MAARGEVDVYVGVRGGGGGVHGLRVMSGTCEKGAVEMKNSCWDFWEGCYYSSLNGKLYYTFSPSCSRIFLVVHNCSPTFFFIFFIFN